jgi:hypothetical protein
MKMPYKISRGIFINAYLRCDNCGLVYEADLWMCPGCLKKAKEAFSKEYREKYLRGA